MTMKRLVIALTLALVLILTMATPAFADAPDKHQDSPAPGLSRAALKHCCNPGQTGPANAAAVFELKFGLTCSKW